MSSVVTNGDSTSGLTDGFAHRVPRISAADVLRLPLPDLFRRANADLVESEITDDGFFGAVVQRRGGRIVFVMPPGRPGWERDVIARSLLGNVLGVDLTPLPAPTFETVTA